MSDEASKIILGETAISAMEEAPRRRFLRRKKATEGRQITECENCGAPLHGHWCAQCGQAAVEYRRSFRHVIVDVLDSFLNWDSKFFASLAWLIARPWYLTNEFVRGHRVRYLQPVRLYLLASILFFFVVNYWAKSIHMEKDPSKKLTREQREKVAQELKDKDIPADVRKKIEKAFAEPSPKPATLPTGEPSAAASPASAIEGAKQSPAPETDAEESGPQILKFDTPAGTPFEKWLEARAKEKLGEKGTKAELFVKTLISNLPYMMLCCIPLFALVLKLLYIRHRIFYIDHLVYALHIHSFAYASLILIGLLTIGILRVASGALAGWLIALLWIAFTVQIFLSIRAVYRQGWIKTIIKFWVGGAVYLVILVLGLAGTFFATLIF
jgi:hypothetical protein